MNTIIHNADSRGHADYGWLNTYYSFSFANWYDAERIQFGMLRVINDDIIAAGMGFGTHPHDNMEIITIPLEGDLAHKDSMGNSSVIKNGDVQVMSAGTGIQHSEFNPNSDTQTKLFQIWIFPKHRNVAPRYQQISLNLNDRTDKLQQIVSPNPEDDGVWIHQDAWIHIGKFNTETSLEYIIKKKGNGVYCMIITGEINFDGQKLATRDALGVWDTDKINMTIKPNTELLLIEIPM